MKRLIPVVLWSAALTASISAAQPATAPAATAARAPATPPGGGELEVDPINCAWRTDKTAIQVGERFTLVLTCGVVETDRDKVVADPNQFDGSALSLAPFEIVSSVRHEDVVEPPRRYFQYEYSVRVIGNAFFGLDVDIPGVTVKYTIASATGENEGREHQYLLPALPVRVLSLVPAKATDIRDSSSETFADREARSRRASQEIVAAAVAFGFAVVLIGLAMARVIGQFRKRTPAASRLVSPFALLGACAAAMRRLKSDVAGDGWTPERNARGLAILRVAGAVALGRPVAQTAALGGAIVREGQVPLRVGLIRPKRTLLSAATSPVVIEQQLAAAAQGGSRPPAVAAALEEIREVLHLFSTTRYGRHAELDASALDNGLDRAAAAIRRLRLANMWPMRRMAGSVVKAAAAVGAAVWLR